MARTGAFAYLKYGYENTFKGGSSLRNKYLGRAMKASSSATHNAEPIYELGQNNPSTFLYKQFEGSLSVDWALSNPWFFKLLLGQVNTTGSAPPYTHTFTRSTTLPSAEIEIGFNGERGDGTSLLKGTVLSSVSISSAVNDIIKVRGEFLYAKRDNGTYGTPGVDTFDPYVFANMTLELPSGTVLAEVQSAELTINNNVLGVYELGNYEVQGALKQAFEVKGRLSITMKDRTFLDMLRDSYNNMVLKITNGLTGANEVSITINLSKVFFESHNVSYEPNAIVVEDVSLLSTDITSVVAKNAVSSVP